ncbi:methylated-DNA--[protein]-cysteine S-methyltransferase [Helicobacter felis]|uniref:methylated-DNA--[protein]-cysteine S-methyltransferase n=1 Tax=Helicobacter felis (strain ATCC 49179 / CCUG 28539 / NCTC 12436 / CS1) TaxID=936155 RepID=E7A943_HELFC|nr:methylated-DNA--[protein]-cysteine S-methyltransferase [Helicobacter felis]CBY83270.1 methylated-DNA--protein-cysteine methyltransferase [Helicobacter felis ATCC 49179]
MSCQHFLKTPKGFPAPYLRVRTSALGLQVIDFTHTSNQNDPPTETMHAVINALEHYFKGILYNFNLLLDLAGSSFQKQVWQALQTIPYAQTRTYAQIAQQTASPKAYRAVGNANHANPCPIVIPCHRVVRASGDLGGYGGGVDIKAWLLTHERSCVKSV